VTGSARALAAVTVAGLVFAALGACNALVGVEDVKLRRVNDADVDEDDAGIDLGDGGPVPRPNVLQTGLGDGHTCARKQEGSVQCWGDDAQGQNGAGTIADGGFSRVPRPVVGIDDAVDLASGRNHVCVVRRGGGVSCWGYNFDGQLGNPEAMTQSATPVAVVNVTRAQMVAAGGNFSCALRSTGTIVCWGGNGSGQLGNGTQDASGTPVAVAGVSGAVAVTAGQAHACAVKSEGSVVCWGDGRNGQLGGGTPKSSLDPVTVDGLPPAKQVVAGERSSCALTVSGAVYCWGANELGQLGTGASNANPNPAPVVVANLDDATALSAGRNHVCALRQTGGVMCWGAAAGGQLGDGVDRGDGGAAAQPSVVYVKNVSGAVSVGTGVAHSCAAGTNGQISCWGANGRGALGDGTTQNALMPTRVTGYP
jgi:alpha-tubulin suppressor-like RCC1 family protein